MPPIDLNRRRDHTCDELTARAPDVLVIGGGILGAGVARDAAMRGLRVGLVEQNDLEAAEAHLSQGLELGKWGGRLDAVRNAADTLSRLRQAQGDANGALAAVEEAQSALGEPPSPLAKGELLAIKARILVRQGDLGIRTGQVL